ncbi:hypothetical protein AX018_103415 [Paracidovorax anthurii]|uniref:Uncharacterized protein n=1 Tax=Paracidovorax anthurii TaxID=78229 RepID=A0A328Z024_9BURK|nr:hypothetical protein AX018_103415 [Paracidovorax anthurii]
MSERGARHANQAMERTIAAAFNTNSPRRRTPRIAAGRAMAAPGQGGTASARGSVGQRPGHAGVHCLRTPRRPSLGSGQGRNGAGPVQCPRWHQGRARREPHDRAPGRHHGQPAERPGDARGGMLTAAPVRALKTGGLERSLSAMYPAVRADPAPGHGSMAMRPAGNPFHGFPASGGIPMPISGELRHPNPEVPARAPGPFPARGWVSCSAREWERERERG